MSKAFACVNRAKLLTILHSILPYDCYRIIQYLLSTTTLETKINGQKGNPFRTTIGTPQGDALSPVLFTIYLEAALRECRRRCPPLPPWSATTLHLTTQYADECDWIHQDREINQQTLTIVTACLADYDLQVNPSKTKFAVLAPSKMAHLAAQKTRHQNWSRRGSTESHSSSNNSILDIQ